MLGISCTRQWTAHWNEGCEMVLYVYPGQNECVWRYKIEKNKTKRNVSPEGPFFVVGVCLAKA